MNDENINVSGEDRRTLSKDVIQSFSVRGCGT
jgi:hypothetical protein